MNFYNQRVNLPVDFSELFNILFQNKDSLMSKGNHRDYSSFQTPEIIVIDEEFEKEEKKYYLRTKNSRKKQSPLPKKRIQKITKNKTDMKINICLSNMILKKKDISTLHCSHKFHSHCLKFWKNIKSTCPLCRREI